MLVSKQQYVQVLLQILQNVHRTHKMNLQREECQHYKMDVTYIKNYACETWHIFNIFQQEVFLYFV